MNINEEIFELSKKIGYYDGNISEEPIEEQLEKLNHKLFLIKKFTRNIYSDFEYIDNEDELNILIDVFEEFIEEKKSEI